MDSLEAENEALATLLQDLLPDLQSLAAQYGKTDPVVEKLYRARTLLKRRRIRKEQDNGEVE